jgi:3-methyladenine DNA glycosylase Mpg
VAALPALSPASFTVSWSGSDGPDGSGIASYSVYVSDDGGPFTGFQTATTQTSATFNGKDGHTYGFYSVATDNAGNIQPTPTAAQASTRVDAVAPTSSVAALPAFSPGSFTVSWSGCDNPGGSGIASYSAFVSDDGGPYTAFQTATTRTSATFTGQDGHTYAFYSVATDHAGNVQATPASAQATTLVDATAPASSVAAPPTFSPGSFTVSWSGGDGAHGSGVASYSLFVSDDGGPFTAFRTATTQTSATFNGKDGHTYGFYSVATDNAGNVQPSPTAAQASTRVDAVAPTSSVAALPAEFDTASFTVSWSGSDNPGGSGIASYSVFVSDDGGPFTRWLAATAQTSAVYTGSPGHSYGFYSVATDNAGNVQAAPAGAQASTQLVPPPAPPPPAPPAEPVGPIAVMLVPRRFGKKTKLVAEVLFAGGLPPLDVTAPYQQPTYHAITVMPQDFNGDGTFNSLLFSARRGKRQVSTVMPV